MPLEDGVVSSQRSPLCKTRSSALCLTPSHPVPQNHNERGCQNAAPTELSTRQNFSVQRRETRSLPATYGPAKRFVLLCRDGSCVLLSLEAVVTPQELLVLLVRAELDGGVRDDADHGGGVPSPEAPEAFVEVGAINQPVSLLRASGAKVRHGDHDKRESKQ